jgi:hypothetical protein
MQGCDAGNMHKVGFTGERGSSEGQEAGTADKGLFFFLFAFFHDGNIISREVRMVTSILT